MKTLDAGDLVSGDRPKPPGRPPRHDLSDPVSAAGVGHARQLAIPEMKALRELRFALARGGLPPPNKRTPEDNARIAAFRALEELLRLLDQYRRRIEAGERCRLVEREHPRESGRLVLELTIED